MLQPIYFRTLRDYASRYSVHAWCPTCRHDVELKLMAVAQSVGWDLEPIATGWRG